jgi:hypothetical protein
MAVMLREGKRKKKKKKTPKSRREEKRNVRLLPLLVHHARFTGTMNEPFHNESTNKSLLAGKISPLPPVSYHVTPASFKQGQMLCS